MAAANSWTILAFQSWKTSQDQWVSLLRETTLAAKDPERNRARTEPVSVFLQVNAFLIEAAFRQGG